MQVPTSTRTLAEEAIGGGSIGSWQSTIPTKKKMGDQGRRMRKKEEYRGRRIESPLVAFRGEFVSPGHYTVGYFSRKKWGYIKPLRHGASQITKARMMPINKNAAHK